MKLVPHDWNTTVYVLFSLILLLVETDLVPKEKYSKKNVIRPFSSSGGKIIPILLTKVIAFYVGFFVVHI